MASSRAAQPAAGPTWRQFSFYDASEVKDAADLALAPEVFRSLTPPYILIAPSPSSPLANSITCIISDARGYISLLDRRFQVEKRWKAWAGDDEAGAAPGTGAAGGSAGARKGKGRERERGVVLLECGGVLLGIGEDESSSQFPMLKIWDLTHDDKKTKSPVLMRSVRIGVGNRAYPVSAIATTSNLSYLAIGLVSGQVLLYRHLAQSLTASPLALASFPKARILWEGSVAEPITGLGFREPWDSRAGLAPKEGAAQAQALADKDVTGLFFTTPNKVICAASVTGKGTEPRVLEELGAGLGCVGMTGDRRELVVGRDDGLYLYGTDAKGSCIAYEGPKASIYPVQQSVVIVSPPFTPSAASASGTVRRAAATAGPTNGSGSGSTGESAKVTVFDLENKFVAYSGVFKEGVRETFGTADQLFVVRGDGRLSRLQEQPTSAKLEALFKRSYYQLAISLARSGGVDDAGIADIYSKYGDHLYTKGDFDGAVTQYVKTLGFLQPSYVIRKFLDGQRIHNLTTYLQELHAKGLANPDHTTLLLNCYTKTADKSRLDRFLKSESLQSDTGHDGELPFDLDTAIRVCRQAGFYEHAVYLARKYNKHEDYLSIQIEDAKDYADALTYLRSLGPAMAESNLLKYGRSMLLAQPEETTDLLIDLCSGTLLQKREEAKKAASAAAFAARNKADQQGSGSNYLSYIGYDKVTGALGLGGDEKASPARRPAEDGPAEIIGSTEDSQPAMSKPAIDTSYDPPSLRQYFAHFVDHRPQFKRFLETVAADRWQQRVNTTRKRSRSHLQQIPVDSQDYLGEGDANESDQRAVWNTLLEIYLAEVQERQNSQAEEQAVALLEQANEVPLDLMHALILCSANDFVPGMIGLWERLGMYEDILRFWMQQEEPADGPSPSQNVIKHLNIYGPTNTHLYPLVLRYLTSSGQLLSRHADDLRHILQVIDEEHIMAPLAVVQLLSRNDVASIGVVKDWLKAKVAETRQDVESDKKLVDSYRSETREREKEMASLADTKHPQVFQVTRCASCGGQLDLPSVHFMCKHSYHQRCLPDSDPECPACSRQYAVIREIRRNHQAMADQHELFVSEVGEAEDGFAVIAGAFGRQLFGAQAQ